jgi:DNA-directed RNA polymerase specialized sigma24 family protein
MTYPGAADSPGVPGPQADPATTAPHAANSAQGDEHEFARFYRDHISRLAAYLVYQGAAAHLAADIAQDAMITAYQC